MQNNKKKRLNNICVSCSFVGEVVGLLHVWTQGPLYFILWHILNTEVLSSWSQFALVDLYVSWSFIQHHHPVWLHALSTLIQWTLRQRLPAKCWEDNKQAAACSLHRVHWRWSGSIHSRGNQLFTVWASSLWGCQRQHATQCGPEVRRQELLNHSRDVKDTILICCQDTR